MNDELDEILDSYSLYTLRGGYWASEEMIRENTSTTKQAILDYISKNYYTKEQILELIQIGKQRCADDPEYSLDAYLEDLENHLNKLEKL